MFFNGVLIKCIMVDPPLRRLIWTYHNNSKLCYLVNKTKEYVYYAIIYVKRQSLYV